MLYRLHHQNLGRQKCGIVDFFPEKFTLPFPSPQDLATQAAADLTRALLHPQPAGPFCHTSPRFSKAPHNEKQKLVFPPPKRGTTMHLRGCVHMFHLQGCQTQRHSICLLRTTYQHTHLQTHIKDKKHL
jgi:hypothetical protein